MKSRSSPNQEDLNLLIGKIKGSYSYKTLNSKNYQDISRKILSTLDRFNLEEVEEEKEILYWGASFGDVRLVEAICKTPKFKSFLSNTELERIVHTSIRHYNFKTGIFFLEKANFSIEQRKESMRLLASRDGENVSYPQEGSENAKAMAQMTSLLSQGIPNFLIKNSGVSKEFLRLSIEWSNPISFEVLVRLVPDDFIFWNSLIKYSIKIVYEMEHNFVMAPEIDDGFFQAAKCVGLLLNRGVNLPKDKVHLNMVEQSTYLIPILSEYERKSLQTVLPCTNTNTNTHLPKARL